MRFLGSILAAQGAHGMSKFKARCSTSRQSLDSSSPPPSHRRYVCFIAIHCCRPDNHHALAPSPHSLIRLLNHNLNSHSVTHSLTPSLAPWLLIGCPLWLSAFSLSRVCVCVSPTHLQQQDLLLAHVASLDDAKQFLTQQGVSWRSYNKAGYEATANR
eukprot:GHVU01070636.1.p1 GENE.GHVU01070636.1~~GHVU01070636.1.p1  ORF type:complete len:158 (-),score=14.76 GHVU01070636.1:185-658(-)